MTIYTDGSLQHEHGTRLTGAGIVAFREGDAIFQERMALGGCSKVYDAEMEGLARGAEAMRDWIQQAGADHGVRHIRFFADNTGAIQRIYKGTPGLDQACSRRFREAIHFILDAHPDLLIDISWVPGHHNIHGNDIADGLAKRGCSDAIHSPKKTQ